MFVWVVSRVCLPLCAVVPDHGLGQFLRQGSHQTALREGYLSGVVDIVQVTGQADPGLPVGQDIDGAGVLRIKGQVAFLAAWFLV